MRRLLSLLKLHKITKKPMNDIKQEVLVKEGRAQFQALLKKGLQIPVVLL